MMAMTAMGGACAQHIKVFIQDLTAEEKSRTLELYMGELAIFFENTDACRWLSEHVDLIDDVTLRLTRYICRKGLENAYELLQLSRITDITESLDIFNSVAQQFMKSDKHDWVSLSLEKLPMQQKVTLDACIETLTELKELRRHSIFSSNKEKIISSPFCEWQHIFQQLTEETSSWNVDRVTLTEALKEL